MTWKNKNCYFICIFLRVLVQSSHLVNYFLALITAALNVYNQWTSTSYACHSNWLSAISFQTLRDKLISNVKLEKQRIRAHPVRKLPREPGRDSISTTAHLFKLYFWIHWYFFLFVIKKPPLHFNEFVLCIKTIIRFHKSFPITLMADNAELHLFELLASKSLTNTQRLSFDYHRFWQCQADFIMSSSIKLQWKCINSTTKIICYPNKTRQQIAADAIL